LLIFLRRRNAAGQAGGLEAAQAAGAQMVAPVLVVGCSSSRKRFRLFQRFIIRILQPLVTAFLPHRVRGILVRPFVRRTTSASLIFLFFFVFLCASKRRVGFVKKLCLP
jgi:hypothetical protein